MAAGTVRAKRLWWSMAWAVVSYIVTTMGTALTDYLTSVALSPLSRSLISTGVGLLVVMIGVLIDQARSGGDSPVEAAPVPQQPYGAPPPPVKRPSKRYPWVVALVIVLALCGVGGFGVTYLFNLVSDKVVCFVRPAACATATERLAQPISVTKEQLTVEITSVTSGSGFTVVHLTARNEGEGSVFLPVYGRTQLAVPGRNTLSGDPMRSDWVETVPAGGQISGYLVFNDELPDGPIEVVLSFTWPGGPSVTIPLGR